MYKKYINRITGFLTIVMITLFSSSLSAQYISGPTTVTFGQYADYYLVGASNDQVASSSWTVDYGSIQNQSTGVNYVSVLYSFQGTNYIAVEYFNGFYWDSLYLQVEVVGAPLPIPTLSSVTQPTCATSTGSFTITNYNASYVYAASPSSGVSISGSTVTAPQGSYTIIATSGGSSSSPSASVTVNAQPSTPTAPTVGTITQPTVTTATGSVILSGLPSGSWIINPGNISGSGTSKTVTGLAASQTYNFTVTNSSGCTSSASSNVVVNAQPSGSVCGLSDENYIQTIAPQTGTTDVSTLTAAQKLESVTYFDGLGRPMQSVGIRAGVKSDGSAIDIITHIGYDAFGRQTKEYLPYTDTGSCGIFRTGDIDSATKSFYSTTKYENTTNPYSEKELEASPLNRVLKQAAPGNDWKLGNGHEIKLDYQTNTASEVKNFGVSLALANNTYTPTLTQSTVNNGFYNANELYKTVTYDENTAATPSETAGSTVEFKNKQGQVVLKRTYGTVGTGTTNEKYDTYYVYDDYGNLTYVLPPKASDLGSLSNSVSQNVTSTAVVTSGNNLQLTATNSITLLPGFHAQAGSTFTASITAAGNDNQSVLDNLCYQYKYDHRNRLVEKKLPGKQWEYIVYDKLDRPVLTQDANLKAQNKWLFTKYDAFGRVAYTGLINNNNSSRTVMQSAADGTSSQYVTQSTTATTIAGTTIHYDNGAYPNVAVTDEIYTINYYDNYGFDLDGGTSVVSYGETPITNAKGLSTGSKVRVLGSSNWITNVIYYDAKARPIYNYTKNNYLGVIQKVKNELDFVGKVKKTSTEHERNNVTTTVLDSFTYDSQGRLLTQTQKINNQADELIVSNVYDELGQLKEKGVGGKATQSRLQTVDYTYNVRGWLKGINDGDASNSTITMGTGDLFGFQINYNNSSTGTPLYNGNISQTFWKTTNPIDTSLRNYNYSYDALNRLTSAVDNLARYNESLSYDKNGNIMNLLRNGYTNDIATQLGIMDNLTYGYDAGNKLFSVEDSSNSAEGFKDGSHTTQEYSYDDNGNMKTDANKGITAIAYNHLNLPTDVTLAGGTIHYDYDATGVKQRKVAAGITTDYAGGFQYEGVNLKFFPTAEGYANNNAGIFSYIYQYKDHLGNVRLSYGDNNNDGAVTTSEIVEESNYYPFGLKQKVAGEQIFNSSYKYRYNSKEYQDELNLNVYDYGARMYDPAIGRWNVMDGKGELYFSSSPYVYASNTPVNAIDPDGNIVIFINGQHGGSGGSPDYWRNYTGRESNFMSMPNRQAFDISVMNQLGDHRALYRDGAMGGTANTNWETNFSKNNLFSSSRINGGYEQGQKDAKSIIANLARDKTTGEIVETIKIITHSMGGAYGKGYVKALKEYIRTLPKALQYQVRITLVADFDPYQAGALTADGNIKTQQFKHEGDGNIFGLGWLANENEQGLNAKKDVYTNTGTSTDHSIMTFFNDISKLSEGTYKWNGTSWVKQ